MVSTADSFCTLAGCEDCREHTLDLLAARPSHLQFADGELCSENLTLLPEHIIAALREGRRPSDRVFDRLLPKSMRRASSRYWTPLAVAMRAAEWLRALGIGSVVDIGSGAGKFCVAAALVAPARFTGIEQREPLVAAARELARSFGLQDRVTFVHDVFGRSAPPQAEAYYLYNPFGENLFDADGQLEGEAELSDERYFRDIALVEELLHAAAVGTCVVTYNGFGGEIPESYRRVCIDRELPNLLQLWRKTDKPWRDRRSDQPSYSSDAEEVEDGVDECERVRRAAGHE